MPFKQTVAEVAQQHDVSLQTVRGWVTHGAPIIRAGRRGGPGSILDGARLPGWLEKRRFHATTIGELMQDGGNPCGGNFLRWLVEYHSQTAIEAMGVGWRLFYDEKLWRDLGIKLTDKQARELTWRAFGLSASFVAVYLYDGQFETDLERDTDMDLDATASLMFRSDFETSWVGGDSFPVPEKISALLSEKKLAELSVKSRRLKKRGKK